MMADRKDFDYENFVRDLCEQAEKLVPDDILPDDKKYIMQMIFNFCTIACDALKKDRKLSLDNTLLITQFIGEWTFHKSIDLTRASIEREIKDKVLQQIAYVIYEIAKEAIKRDLPQEQIVQVVEHHVNKTCKEELDKLYNNKEINRETYENALAQSNIDIMWDTKPKSLKTNIYDKNNTLIQTSIDYIGKIAIIIWKIFLYMVGIGFLIFVVEVLSKLFNSFRYPINNFIVYASIIVLIIAFIVFFIIIFDNNKKILNKQKTNEEIINQLTEVIINQLTEEINKLKAENEELKQKLKKKQTKRKTSNTNTKTGQKRKRSPKKTEE